MLATRRWKELNQADFKFSDEALEQKEFLDRKGSGLIPALIRHLLA